MDAVEFWITGVVSCPATVGFGTGSLEFASLTLLMTLVGMLASAVRTGGIRDDDEE